MLTVCTVLATIHARDRQMDGWTDRQNYDSQDRPLIDAHAVTKLWQSAFQLYFCWPRTKIVNFMNNYTGLCTILDNDGIPVEIQYLMNLHLCCRKSPAFSLISKLPFAKLSVFLCKVGQAPETSLLFARQRKQGPIGWASTTSVGMRQAGPEQNSSLYGEVGVLWSGVGHFWQIFEREGASSTNHFGVRKLGWLPFRVVSKKICSASFSFVTIHASDRQTERQTNGKNCDSKAVCCITCSPIG